jgi:hypothetical protein
MGNLFVNLNHMYIIMGIIIYVYVNMLLCKNPGGIVCCYYGTLAI